MSKWDKLLEKLLQSSSNIRFEELKKILEHYGYTMSSSGSGSSHYTFRKPGKAPITIPKHIPIKRVYIEIVRKAVEEEIHDEEN